MRETVISLTDGRILAVRFNELSMERIINVLQDQLEMVPLVKIELCQLCRVLSSYLYR